MNIRIPLSPKYIDPKAESIVLAHQVFRVFSQRRRFILSNMPHFFVVMALFFSFALTPAAAVSAERVLDGIEISTRPAESKIYINFILPLRHVSHSPAASGLELEIKLVPVWDNDMDAHDFSIRESRGFTPTDEVPLSAVEYDGSASDGPSLILRFSRPVKFLVESGPNHRNMVVELDSSTEPPSGSIKGHLGQSQLSGADSSSQKELSRSAYFASLMEEAEREMTVGNYSRAIRIYTKILSYSDHQFAQDAQEFLGLARERNGQMAHAKAEYEEFLRLYPKGEASDRVRQRLAALLTAASRPKKKLRKAGEDETDAAGWKTEAYGGFYQFYDRYESSVNGEPSTVDRSSLLSNLDLNVKRFNDNKEFVARFDGGYEKNFTGEDENASRINTGYVDYFNRHSQAFARIGRQTRNTGGVLGRFDGAALSRSLSDNVKINAVGGYPVESSDEKKINSDRYFYGLSFDLNTFADSLKISPYIINQQVDGITDRRAVGLDMRNSGHGHSIFNLVDYDFSYKELNIFLLTGNKIFADGTRLNASFDYRKSPFLTTRNALQGQGVETIADLLDSKSEEEIRQLARDRTAVSKTAVIGASRPLGANLEASIDATLTKMSGSETSGGVEAMPETGWEGFYSLWLVGSSLMKEGDAVILGFRYSDTDARNTISLNLNTRYPVSREFRLNPRLRLDWRKDEDGSDSQQTIRPSLKMDFRWRKVFNFEMESGYEWQKHHGSDEENMRTFFFTGGYRLDF